VTTLAAIESEIARLREEAQAPHPAANRLLGLAEETLEHWVRAHGEVPTLEAREGFRLLALHRQGARDEPSFNACRETCREAVYHYNLIAADPASVVAPRQVRLMAMVVMHLFLFVSGKLENAKLGEFCCSARPLRAHAG
jgi:hypothetical protein